MSVLTHSRDDVSNHIWYFVLTLLSIIFCGVEIIILSFSMSLLEYGFSEIIEFSICVIISSSIFFVVLNAFSKSFNSFKKKLNFVKSFLFAVLNTFEYV